MSYLYKEFSIAEKSPPNLNNETFHVAGDTKMQYKRNRKRQPDTWYYRHKTVSYTTNSLGYRTDEFDCIDFDNSIVALGCSMTFGIGVDNAHTWVNHLEGYLGIPVINLGVPGTSVELATLLSANLRAVHRPRAIIWCWPPVDRYAEYRSPEQPCITDCVHHYDQWHNLLPKYKGYNYKTDWRAKNLIHMKKDRLLWSDTAYVETTFFEYEHLDYTSDERITNLKLLDRGRDLVHPGILSHNIAAKTIKSIVEKLL